MPKDLTFGIFAWEVLTSTSVHTLILHTMRWIPAINQVILLHILNYFYAGMEYSMSTELIPCLFMTWLLVLQGFLQSQYSVLPMYRGCVYRRSEYIVVTCWTPFFAHTFCKFCRHCTQECGIFHEILVTPSTPLARDIFSQNQRTAVVFDHVHKRQFFA